MREQWSFKKYIDPNYKRQKNYLEWKETRNAITLLSTSQCALPQIKQTDIVGTTIRNNRMYFGFERLTHSSRLECSISREFR